MWYFQEQKLGTPIYMSVELFFFFVNMGNYCFPFYSDTVTMNLPGHKNLQERPFEAVSAFRSLRISHLSENLLYQWLGNKWPWEKWSVLFSPADQELHNFKSRPLIFLCIYFKMCLSALRSRLPFIQHELNKHKTNNQCNPMMLCLSWWWPRRWKVTKKKKMDVEASQSYVVASILPLSLSANNFL